ncbi:MAG: addiction module protein [Bdellovibrionaceae bacterium]|nr:addiction module protein [Pseudobdellovibrionaceae bacterium]
MVITLDQIVEEVAQLPGDVAAELIERILVARHGGLTDDVENAWTCEARQRMRQIAAGEVEGVPAEEVMERMRRIVGQ